MPLLMYGTCVAEQRGSVSISSANPVDIRFAVTICDFKLVVEGTLTV